MTFFSKIFRKKEKKLPPFDLSGFKTDIHSHLIPGIDDGAKTIDESIAILAKFESLGYKKVITTPHIMSDYFKNTPETILSGLKKLKETAQSLNLKIEIEAAAEYYFDEGLINQLKNKEKLLTFGDNYLLFEFPFHEAPLNIDGLLFEMLTQKYQPVLAHAERYVFLHNDIEKINHWRKQGVHIQINLNSISGHYGPAIKKVAEKLIDNKWVDFVGTDCHRIEHLMILEKNISNPYLHKLGALNLKNREL